MPAKSPDLNPIEMFWGWVRRQLRLKDLEDMRQKLPTLEKTAYEVTCKEKCLGPIIKQAAREVQLGEASECSMLLRWLKVFSFTEKLELSTGVQIPECPVCLSRMLLHYAAVGQGHM